jgi:hypothetical protein
MIPDIRFEADFLRAALLAGLVRERDACAWADALLHVLHDEQGRLAEVALAPLEMTAMREALRPLAGEPRARETGAALLAFMALDPDAACLGVADRLRVLSVLRREGALSDSATRETKTFDDRLMLAAVHVQGESAPSHEELTTWLHGARPSAYFRVVFDRDDEQAAFLAALSRVVVRDRRFREVAPVVRARAWTVGEQHGRGGSLLLNEPLWKMASQEFSPLPFGARIPYITVPANAVMALETESASAMGVNEAAAHLAGI